MNKIDCEIYLIVPASELTETDISKISRLVNMRNVPCIRIKSEGLSDKALNRNIRNMKFFSTICETKIILDNRIDLVKENEIDGIHFTYGTYSIKEVRTTLGENKIIGISCGFSKHIGLKAGESGADYVAFSSNGIKGQSANLSLNTDLFKWWSEFIEVPLVAEHIFSNSEIEVLSEYVDFLSLEFNFWEI